MRRHLSRNQNEPSEATTRQKLASDALNRGDYETARVELEKLSTWEKREYFECRLTFEHNSESCVRTLSQIGAVCLSQAVYTEARDKYVEILSLSSVPPDQRIRYERL